MHLNNEGMSVSHVTLCHPVPPSGILVVSLPLSVTVKYTVVAIKVPSGPPVELHEEEPELMF